GFRGFEDIFSAFGDIFGGRGSIFDDFFGGRRARRGARDRGAHLKVEIAVTLDEVRTGAKKTIELTRNEICSTCRGSGARPGSGPVRCRECGGRGEIVRSQGFFALRTTCPRCHGQGEVVESPCSACRGSGRRPEERRITVTIPAGVHHGMQLRMPGEGEPGPGGGPRGDLFCEIVVRSHPLFSREGDDVLVEVPTGFALAALGGEIEVPTLQGKSSLKVPRGTQSGTLLRMKGMGLPHLDGYGVGDQYVRVRVEVPKRLAKEQEELLRRYAATEEQNVGSDRRSFLDKVRELFG
ncbi:MAG: DnaJ C-terminal domain-containing protein, partial [Planctomycetota bacterium]